jgi:fibronectin type 3 domain-containing protein
MRRTFLVGFLAAAVGGVFISGSVSAQTCPANVPHITGTWETLPYQMPINPISANLLRNGKVLIVAGSENDASNNKPGAESYRAAIWDPMGADESSISVQNLTYDVFCSGTAALPDGRSLIVGGTSDYSFKGDRRASFFDPVTGAFAQSQNMVDGRWYATATTLGDGRVMAMSGLTASGGTSTTVEIYDLRNAGTGWSPPTSVPFTPPLYPRVFLLPDGKVFYTGQGSGSASANSWIFDPVTGNWTASAATTTNRSYGSSVILPLLPPSYAARVMNFGGGSPATSSTEIIDLSAASPSYTPGPNMSTGRIQMNAVILPNGKVLAEGGSVNNEAPDTPGKTADLYDPVANKFSSAGTASYSRLYHSPAILLPDATVASLGSNPGPRGSYEAAIEIYTPPYLFDANDHLITTNRPSITGLSSTVIGYNTGFSLTYTSTSAIASAVLVHPGSATHAEDMDQRLIGLCGPSPQAPCSSVNNGAINLTSPPNGNIAPPGYYMLFILDGAGVPSVAKFIQLTPYLSTPPTGVITTPASDVTISAGGTVAFGTTIIASNYSWVFSGGSPSTSTAQNPGNVTFAAPGTYSASLTVIDSNGNSDPSPPTRTITVLPTTPGFSITVGPAAQEVVPGGSTTYTVTVTPLSGFTGTVNLSVGSESGFPTGITSGGFSPTVISGSGSSTLTMNTTTSTIPWALSLTVTGTSGAISHTASTTLLVNLVPPASLTATPGDKQVSLSWPASIGATSYHVKSATASGGPYDTLACLPATSTSYTDIGLTDGTPYFYVVSAAYAGNPNSGGESADSGETSATPQASLPSPPGGLSATPGNNQVALAWNPSSGATSYRVKRATVSGGPYVLIASPTSPSYTDTSVTNGATYYYVVSAVNSAGESNNSSEVNATPQAVVPAAPTSLTAKSNKPKTIDLHWIQSVTSGVTKNSVYRRTSSGSYPSTPVATINATTSYRDAGVSNGATYCYVVTATGSGGESGPSNEQCAPVK